MPGARLASFRSGDNNEMLAQAILGSVAFTTIVPRSEDVGHDFICVLAEREGALFRAGPSFVVQVKSDPGELRYEKDYEVKWLLSQEAPFFIGVVTRAELRLDIYSTWRRLDAKLGPGHSMGIVLVPNVEGQVSQDALGVKTVPLGRPIISVALPDLVRDDPVDFSQALKTWILMDQDNIANARAGIFWTLGPERYETNCSTITSWQQTFYVNSQNLGSTLKLLGRSASSLRLELQQKFPHDYSEHKDVLERLLAQFSPYVEENARSMLANIGVQLPSLEERVKRLVLLG